MRLVAASDTVQAVLTLRLSLSRSPWIATVQEKEIALDCD